MPRFAAGLALAALVLAACGGDSNDDDGGGGGGGGGNGSGPFTAVVDGETWAADDITIAAQTVPSVPGGFVITGSRTRSATDVASIGLSLYNVTGPGTYPLGVLPSVFGGIGTYGEATGAWVTPYTGASGTVTLSTLTATRIAGTFAFTASNNAGGSRAITEGRFDLPLASGGALPVVPPNAGSRLTGTIAGQAYAAHTVAVTQSGAAGVSFTSLNDRYSVTLVLDGVTAAGTYPIALAPPVRLVAVNAVTGPAPRGSWGTANGTTGSVAITSLTATRVRGTFTGTLAPQGGTGGSLAVTGEFDVGLP
jgi:hypothetical protein